MSDSTTPDVTGASQSTPTPAKASPSGAPTQFSGAPPLLPLLPTQPLSLPILGAPRPHPPSPWYAAAVQDRLRTGALPTLLQPDYSTPPPSATPASQRRSGGGGSHRPWWGFSEGDDVNIPEPRQGDAGGAGTRAGRARATQSDAPAASLGSQDTLPGHRTREKEGVEESTAERDEAGGGGGGGGGGGRGAPSSWWQSQDESQAGHGQGQVGGSQEPMDTREAGDRSKVARSLFEDTPGGVQRQQQQQQQQPRVSRAVVSITMEQARRAEANRQAALAKRRQRLEAQAINLFAAQPTGTPPPRKQTSKIYNELNRVLTAQRRGPAPPPPSPGPSPPAPSSQQGAPLTPEQRERMERSRQAALQRQAERAAAEAAAIMARAEREGQRVRQERANAARAASQQQQQQQRPSPSKDIDQSWQRFVP
jgi:hypothetical protein